MSEPVVEVHRMLVLSTGHLTATTARLLGDVESLAWAPQMTGAYGWLWYVDRDTESLVDFPPEFAAIFKLALDHECHWIRLDADGPQVDGLLFFDW